MTIVNGLQNLLEYLNSVCLLEVLFSNDPIEQLAATAELCDEVDVLFILEVLVKLDDVGVVELLENGHLLLKTLPILNLFALYCLACSLLPTNFVNAFCHHAVCA